MSSNRVAELALLRRFDDMRRAAGHDFGAGQRARELARLERDLDRAAGGWRALEAELEAVTRAELAAAFERIGRPRMRRLELEGYRRETPATVRTMRTWRELEREVTS